MTIKQIQSAIAKVYHWDNENLFIYLRSLPINPDITTLLASLVVMLVIITVFVLFGLLLGAKP